MKARRWLLIVIVAGLLLMGLGLFVGFSSHRVTYRRVGMSTVVHYLSDLDRHLGYLQLDLTGSALYLVDENSFHPVIQSVETLQDGMLVSLVYRPDQISSVDVFSSWTNTRLVGEAATVVELTLYDDFGRVRQEFVTDTYREHPQGFYENDWPQGGLCSLAGGLLVVLALWLGRRSAAVQRTVATGPRWPPSHTNGAGWRVPSG